MSQTFATTDLSDAYEGVVAIAEPLFSDFGGLPAFSGMISTIKCHEDNSLVRTALEQPGQGRVLVIDGGGSLRCALLGDQLAALGHKNGWSGFVIYGCIRDSEAISAMPIGVKALTTHPRKSVKRNEGQRDLTVHFAGVDFVPGHFLYADRDGILIAPNAL